MTSFNAELDRRIIESWSIHEDADPEISTERLMAMVQDDTGADATRQLAALRRAGLLTVPSPLNADPFADPPPGEDAHNDNGGEHDRDFGDEDPPPAA